MGGPGQLVAGEFIELEQYVGITANVAENPNHITYIQI